MEFDMRMRSNGPDPQKRKGSPVPANDRTHETEITKRTSSTSSEYVDDKEQDAGPSGESRRSVTNQDSENIITNTDDSSRALNEKETEGM